MAHAGEPPDPNRIFAATSSLVLSQDRRGRRDEPTGEPESLAGRVKPHEFGDRAARTLDDKKAAVAAARERQREREREHALITGQPAVTAAPGTGTGTGASGLRAEARQSAAAARGGHAAAAALLDGGWDASSYRPRTRETEAVYDQMMSFLLAVLGDVPHDVLASALDGCLEALKDEALTDAERQRAVAQLLQAPVARADWARLVAWGKQITDYDVPTAGGAAAHEAGGMMDEQDNQGVVVLFEDEDEEDGAGDVVVDPESDGDADADIAATGGPLDDGATADAAATPTPTAIGRVKRPKPSAASDEEADGLLDAPDAVREIHTAKRMKRERDAAAAAAAEAPLTVDRVDAFYVQRAVGACYDDARDVEQRTSRALALMGSPIDLADLENALMELFEYEHFELVRKLCVHRDVLVWGTRLAQAPLAEKPAVLEAVRAAGKPHLLAAMGGDVDATASRGDPAAAAPPAVKQETGAAAKTPKKQKAMAPSRSLDLVELAEARGTGHVMTNRKVQLPQGTFKKTFKSYEEIHVPAPTPPAMGADERMIPISELPEWTRPAFGQATHLNRVQSHVFPTAFQSDANMLLCAPTGAGKTNCAVLTILRELEKQRHPRTGQLMLDQLKIVYVAPMKALVSEVVGNLSNRLCTAFGITVAELTGDRHLTKEQISATQLIVTTPEKFDIITRKASDRSYTDLLKLVIIDEVHLLHDDRGPVLESLVSRTLRHVQQTQEPIRLVGLSATLPNYRDVAAFLRVDFQKGLFFFDNGYRPVPLKQQYIGLTEKKALRRHQVMNEIVFEKIKEEAGKNQVMVFCHSRKDTAKTAQVLRDMAVEQEVTGLLVRADAAAQEILTSEAASVANPQLKDVLPYGFGIHHAGMTRADRTLVEDLFAQGSLQVLVCTATLAWGVNLPAHTVIIKGTQIYNPEKGCWVQLSPQDVLQMLGRAGRPQYDTSGDGIIITTHAELPFYLSLINVQLPIESQFYRRLVDNLNAEVVLGTIRSRQEAVDWLGYTYLYVRMLQNPSLYGISVDEREHDPYLVQWRTDLVDAAARTLHTHRLVRYDAAAGTLGSTELGRIASHYYVSHTTMAMYYRELRPWSSVIDLLRIFALSDEFRYIPVREEEALELAKLAERAPIPIRESLDEPAAKVNLLLQAHISRLGLEGFALAADRVYVTQSAGRLIRAIFEVCMRRGWAGLTHKALDLCKMVDKRLWASMNPLRQLGTVPMDLIRRLERKEFPWYRYADLNPQELGELCGVPKAGKQLHRAVHQLPKIEVETHIQPLTDTILRVELALYPDFLYDATVSGGAEGFWVFVEDVNGEHLLYTDLFILKPFEPPAPDADPDDVVVFRLSFTVTLTVPLQPNYYVRVVSDRWLHAQTKVAMSLQALMLPDKPPPPTEVLDLQPVPVTALHTRDQQALYSDRTHFNAIQTHVFSALYASSVNTLVAAPLGSGETVMAELAMLRCWTTTAAGRVVVMVPFAASIPALQRRWQTQFPKKATAVLTGEAPADLRRVDRSDLILTTPEHWESLSKRWRRRARVTEIALLIAMDLHLLSHADVGPAIEVVCSRMRFMVAQTEHAMRLVAFSAPLSDAQDVGEWLGAPATHVFNFAPHVRPVPLQIQLQSFAIPHHASRMLAMAGPAYQAASQTRAQRADAQTIVFVADRRQALLRARDFVTATLADDDTQRFLLQGPERVANAGIEDAAIQTFLDAGIGLLYEGMSPPDMDRIQQLYKDGCLGVLFATQAMAWALDLEIAATRVIVMGTQTYDGHEKMYLDYPIADVLQMHRFTTQDPAGGIATVLTNSAKRAFYTQFLDAALPLESLLDTTLHDQFNTEVDTGTIENKQDAVDYLTWTYFYRRLAANPNYYGLKGASNEQLSDFLSELVETTLDHLETAKCIAVDDDDAVSSLNLGMVASYYAVQYGTIETFSQNITAGTRLRGMAEIVTAAAEFDLLPVRHHEDRLLRQVVERLPPATLAPHHRLDDPHVKAYLLLQAHFARLPLTPDLEYDQRTMLLQLGKLLQAAVDVVASQGALSPALAAMELSQMVVQAVGPRDPSLRQVPHFTPAVVQRLHDRGVQSVFDLLEMEDADRVAALQLSDAQMLDVAAFANRFPNLALTFVPSATEVAQDDVFTLSIRLERDPDEDEDEDAEADGAAPAPKEPVGPVVAPFYPQPKEESWWIVVADMAAKHVLAIKRVVLQHTLSVRMQVAVPEQQALGALDGRIFLMCDSYRHADQEYPFSVNILPAEDDDDDDDDDVGSDADGEANQGEGSAMEQD